MSSIGAKQFLNLRNKLQTFTKDDDLVDLQKIRVQIIDFAPDINTLNLANLFNRAIKRTKTNFDQSLLIDTKHIENLITLRKAALYIQSILLDYYQTPTIGHYIAQFDLSPYHQALQLANKEVDPQKRALYVEYFNQEILDKLMILMPELNIDRLERHSASINSDNHKASNELLH